MLNIDNDTRQSRVDTVYTRVAERCNGPTCLLDIDIFADAAVRHSVSVAKVSLLSLTEGYVILCLLLLLLLLSLQKNT